MTKVGKYLVLSAFFLLALVCYYIGSKVGAIAFIALGFVLELAFWLGIFKSSNKKQEGR